MIEVISLISSELKLNNFISNKYREVEISQKLESTQ